MAALQKHISEAHADTTPAGLGVRLAFTRWLSCESSWIRGRFWFFRQPRPLLPCAFFLTSCLGKRKDVIRPRPPMIQILEQQACVIRKYRHEGHSGREAEYSVRQWHQLGTG